MALRSDTLTILIIDDTPSNLSVAVNLFEDRGYRVAIAQDGEEGLQRAQLVRPDLILLDVMLPGDDGFEVCRRLKELESTRGIPVIFMTALASTDNKVKGFAAGGVDYVTKPLQIDEVIARVGTHLKLHAIQRLLVEQNVQLEKHSQELERRVAERTEELARSESEFRTLSENHPDDIIRFDTQGRILYTNLSAQHSFGSSAMSLMGKTVCEFPIAGNPEWTWSLLNAIRKIVATAAPNIMEFTWPNGRVSEIRQCPELNEQGDVISVLTIGRDITERREAESALRESEQRYRLVFENSPVSLWEEDFSPVKALFDDLRKAGVADLGSYLDQHPETVKECAERVKIVDVNQAAIALHDAASKDALFAGLVNTFTPESIDAFRQELVCLWRGGTRTSMEAVVKTLTGASRSVTVHFAVCPGFEESFAKVLVSLVDITERKQMEQYLEASQLLLRQLASRNEAAREDERRHLKREIHDELGQYLSALRLGISVVDIQLGKIHSPLQEKTQRLITVVDSTIKVVRNVVAALRPSALDMGIVSALEWLAQEYAGNTGITCQLQVPGEDLDMDDKSATAIFRIVQESLTNILRHAQATQVEIALERKGDNYCLEVRDNGQGFDPALRKAESFGLVSIRERALMLGGEVDIASMPGRTVIRVHFPAQEQGFPTSPFRLPYVMETSLYSRIKIA